jgi:cysteine desulfurase
MQVMSTVDPELVYLDHGATTPMAPEARETMLTFFDRDFGNPSGLHATARRARRALDLARDELAEALGCASEEIVFTSGATEADNLAITGVVRTPGALVVSAVEHAAVLRPAERLGSALCPVDRYGRCDLSALAGLISKDTELVSVMTVNSEIGTIEPIAAIVELVHDRAPNALVHSDAAQALRWCDVAEITAGCDLVSISGHKFGGPKGIGALVVRDRAMKRLAPLLVGGAQERELRAGTQNVAGAVAMARAASLAVRDRATTVANVGALTRTLVAGAIARQPIALETVPEALRTAGTAHLRFVGVDAEELVLVLDDLGVAAATGSACASGATEPSHVLLALGLDKAEAREAVRFSLGTATTASDIDLTLVRLDLALQRLGH